ncbi:SDR family NAD(P)-dependent oxidoreductase [Rathayibacter sp. AY1F3]|uniref:SDR family NAD(P)-dependent oxidoreductase n=1 Tax=Rathayibacter sp. AY1F3 TaxID=2080558 RepID=UPI0015E38CEA|nr:SDR family oxidoreductase [Rathayibacter sp. AY1F3]
MTTLLTDNHFTLVGDVALVTGAAGGMGRAITAALVAAGATTVYGWDRVDTVGFGVTGAVVDLSRPDDVAHAAAALEKTPTIVVNAAGIVAARDGFEVDTADFLTTLNVNLVSPYVIQREIGRRLLAAGAEGAFINITSVAGKHAFPDQPDYVASKAGLIGLTRAGALDLSPLITVNGIAPGTVATPMIDKVIADVASRTGLSLADQRLAFEAGIPTKRMQTPEEIAATVVFLASTAARSINGEIVNVDGGATRD